MQVKFANVTRRAVEEDARADVPVTYEKKILCTSGIRQSCYEDNNWDLRNHENNSLTSAHLQEHVTRGIVDQCRVQDISRSSSV
jgi:hypothetical protein